MASPTDRGNQSRRPGLDRIAAVSTPLPPPHVWPNRFGQRAALALSLVLGFLCIAPSIGFALLVFHDPRPEVWILAPFALLLPAVLGGPTILVYEARRPLFEFVPLRGGPEAVVELRKLGGGARPIVMPLGKTQAFSVSAGGPTRSVTYLVAATKTSAGLLFFATGGMILPPALMRWLSQLHASSGSADPSEGSASVEEIAALATRDPFTPPPGIAVERTLQGAIFRYRGGFIAFRNWFIGWALAVGTFLIWPALDPGQTHVTWTGTLIVLGLTELAILYAILLCGPLTVEVESLGDRIIYRRRRFGRTLYAETCPISAVGFDISSPPVAALRCKARLRGITGPDVQGPEASAIIWLSAALQALGR